MNILVIYAAWGPIMLVADSGRLRLSTILHTCLRKCYCLPIVTTKLRIYKHFSCLKKTSGTSYVIRHKDFRAESWT